MKNINKILYLILILALILNLAACKKENPNDNISSIPVVSSMPSSVVEETSSQEPNVSSEVESDTSSIISTVTPPTPAVPQSPITIGYYTVNDPQNARGLNTARNGYSYGIAKNGQAHSISINNQQKFDNMQNVEALALDTNPDVKCMYLTFDCGYEFENLTDSILDTLKEKNVKAAFFCTLDYIKKNPNKVSRMINEGHIVGNHSTTHPDFTTISRTKMAEELYYVDKYLTDNYGYKAKYFRFPTGAYSENCLELVTSLGYKSVFWSLAHMDWETENQPTDEAAFQTVTGRYHNGAVILLHAVSRANTNIMANLIDKAQSDGYVFKSLDEYKW